MGACSSEGRRIGYSSRLDFVRNATRGIDASRVMPELPDITIYREALDARIRGQVLERVRIVNPFVLRTAVPPITDAEGKRVLDVQRLGKRIVLALEDDLFLSST